MEQGSNNLAKSVLELLRLLYRSELLDFSGWGVDLLVSKLNSCSDKGIIIKIVDILEEVT